MSYLTLCQDVARLARVDTAALGTTPTTVTSQTGVLGEIVDWVERAYEDIQSEEAEWAFMVKQGTLSVTNGVRTYTQATIQSSLTTFDRIVPMQGKYEYPYILCYLTATGVSDSSPVFYVPYEDWRGRFDFGTRASGKPYYYTVLPNETLELDPTPDATYTLAFDYRRTIATMSVSADEPIIPTKYQNAIIWRALQYYCITRDETDKFYAKVEKKLRSEMGMLRREQLPVLQLDCGLLY